MSRLILLGPRGSGKSTLGRGLAERLGIDFIDLDTAIVDAAGRSIPELFEAEGEAGFRDRETTALREALQQDTVLATGGGVVVRPVNRDLLLQARCPRVLLLADVEVLHVRINGDNNRPALTDLSGIDEIRHLLAERMPWYEAVASDLLMTSDLEADIDKLMDLF